MDPAADRYVKGLIVHTFNTCTSWICESQGNEGVAASHELLFYPIGHESALGAAHGDKRGDDDRSQSGLVP